MTSNGYEIMPYLITGLPRSRTAWLATVCNAATNTICYHEPTRNWTSWRQIASIYDDDATAGVADSLLALYVEQLCSMYPTLRVLAVLRPIEQVRDALDEIKAYHEGYNNALGVALSKIATHSSVLCVNYDNLDDINIVITCLEYIIPHVEIHYHKLEELMYLNVQQTADTISRCSKGVSPKLIKEIMERISWR
jgi:hypothetical protein